MSFYSFNTERCPIIKSAMASPHYSLRWNNHQNHILNAFDTLLQNETLVDVTLVCEETSVRAHKVVLSACSPYFQRIFSENPCKHPVIVLKDLRGWEVQAIVDFMYKGEISVIQEQLTSLIKAAESLQVRGLAHTEHAVSEKDQPHTSPPPPPPPPPSATLTPLEKLGLFASAPPRNFSSSTGHSTEKDSFSLSPGLQGPPQHFESPLKLPQLSHMPHISFTENPPSPQPRRKQARPRRRSGDFGAQDLTKGTTASPPLETAENLSMKKPVNHMLSNNVSASALPVQHGASIPSPHQVHPPPLKLESEETQNLECSRLEIHTPERDRERERERDRERDRDRLDFCNSTESVNLPPPPPPPDASLDNSSFPPLSSVSALSLTPPHMFSLDSQLGFFPGIESCRTPLLNDIPEQRTENHHIMGKRKSKYLLGRPKGQHSAPRGGPPRSWTNAELTEALQHVWNKKMTTSQASRIFGIPYNSLLMYVRGKYGKSLKLEQLKKDCLGGPTGPLELLGLGPMGPSHGNNNNNNNNNNNASGKSNNPEDMLGPPVSEHDLVSIGPSFNPYTAANFYPDFAASFPVPVSMIHLLPQSEKNRELFGPSMPLPLDITAANREDDCKSGSGRKSRENNNSNVDEEHEVMQQPPPPREDTAQLVEQNGQN
ncbi:protein jim lovell-like isoform X2 [Schistocerca gregaria]|uniref:protein jim lovell-like isoform X2 n=1 Tax=Schistocerca gregaria TaxID=7010 RepID=UPI00211E45A5|nr:protein jim lovell-like isoform X2 [Schistocerca gregaria]